MSASQVLTMGLGSWGTVSRIVTLGYGIGADTAEHDYVIDECTVLRSCDRGDRLYAEGRGDLLSGSRDDLFTSWDRGDLLSSPDRGDRFTREC